MSRLRVLLVDDQPMVLLGTEAALRTFGHEVVVAADAEAALAALADGRFDVLLTDISLPGRSGVELAELALAADPDLRVILSSGHDAAPVPPESPLASLEFLAKPYSLAQVQRLFPPE